MVRWFGLLILFMLGLGIKAQSYAPYYYHLNKQNGMPTDVVYDLYQDKSGFIWFSSELGLIRFDGKNYRNFTMEEQTSKAGACITEDYLGRIWYTNFDGFIYYVENGQLKWFKPYSPLGYFKFGIIDSFLYTVEEDGIVLYDVTTGKRKKNYKIDISRIKSTHSDGKNFYVFTDQLHIVNSNGIKTIPLPQELKDFTAGIMQTSQFGLLFASKYHKFGYYYDFTDFSKIKFPASSTFIQNCSYDGHRNWMSTTDGAILGETNAYFFKGKNISTVFRDREGNYWFGTINNGIYLVPSLQIQFLENSNTVSALTNFGNQLLIGTQNEEIYLTDPNSKKETLVFKGKNKHEIIMLKTFSNSPYIFVGSHDFMILEPNGNVILEYPSAVKDVVALDEKTIAYAATGTCGLILLGETKTDWKNEFKSLDSNKNGLVLIEKLRGKSVAFDSINKNLFFATSKGIFKVGKNETKEIKNLGKSIYATKLCSYKGEIYGLTQNNKVFQIKDDKMVAPIFSSYLIGVKTFSMRVVNNRIYFNTDNGILVYDFKSERFYQKLSYNQNFEFSQFAEIGNRVYVAVNKGILSLSIAHQEKKDYPNLVLDQILINGKNSESFTDLKLKNNENNLEIKYALLNFKPGEKYKVFYKLNDEKWILADENSRKLDLPSMAAGNYVLKLKTEDPNAKPIEINFKIEQVFWKSWAFILLAGMLVLALVVFYFKGQIKKIKYRKELEIKQVHIEKEGDNAKLKAFKAQMNPHFFYNALNTIQSYILTNEKMEAITYLSQFSNLTRKFLEFSEQDYISLQEEIEIIKLYLELEKARFSGDLDYKLELNEIENPAQVYMPVMLLQPYVENALKHGLLHSKKEKELRIAFELKHGVLHISIVDNGIGIEKSKAINAQRGKLKPASFATSAQENRIAILNKNYNYNISAFTEELKDELGQVKGTKVSIQLRPILKK